MGGVGGKGMLTMGTDTGGSSSRPPSWRLRAVAAMRRNRETESQHPSDHVSSVCGIGCSGSRGLTEASTLTARVCCQIPGSKASVEGIWQQALFQQS